MTSRISIGAASAVAVFGVVAFVPSALAAPPDFNMGWTVGGGDTINYNWTTGLGTLNGFGDWTVPLSEQVWSGWNYTGTLVGQGPEGGDWELMWNCVFNANSGGGGAFITANIVVTNNDVSNQNFSLLMTLPTGFLGQLVDLPETVG